MRNRVLCSVVFLALASAGVAVLPAASQAAGTAASETLSGGSLAFINSTPAAALTFPATTLNGTNQTVTAPLPFDIGDATGSGAGWDVTATSVQFTSTTHTLPTTATTVLSGPTSACDAGATGCTTATNTVTYPYTLPSAAVTAPAATKLFNAALNTGMGNETFAPTWTLAIPSSAVASATAYTSAWTFSLVSGP